MKKTNTETSTFVFEHTPEGECFLAALEVNLQAVDCGDREELKRYAYCMAAGAASAKGLPFDFTIDEFIKACPPNWNELARNVRAKDKNAKAKKAESDEAQKKNETKE